MTNATKPARFYYLETRMIWDRPELRGSTFTYKPKTGEVFCDRRFVGHDQAAAVRAFDRIVAGEDDSCSEYFAQVALLSSDRDGNARRVVRTDVYRVRDKGAERAEVVKTEREQFDRKMAAQAA